MYSHLNFALFITGILVLWKCIGLEINLSQVQFLVAPTLCFDSKTWIICQKGKSFCQSEISLLSNISILVWQVIFPPNPESHQSPIFSLLTSFQKHNFECFAPYDLKFPAIFKSKQHSTMPCRKVAVNFKSYGASKVVFLNKKDSNF